METTVILMSAHNMFRGLYVITESALSKGRSNAAVVAAALSGGARWIQLREKTWSKEQYLTEAKIIAKLCKKYCVPFIVNDHVDIACAVDAYGVHLGQEDMPIAEAKKIATKKLIYGKSTHSLQQALDAAAEGADYISVGPIFQTRAKPYTVGIELITQVRNKINIPFVAIGGITMATIHEVRNAGAYWIAMISAIVTAHDIRKTTQAYATILENG